MADRTEYAIKVNGTIVGFGEGSPLVFHTKKEAVAYADEWVTWSENDRVEIIHRRVIEQPWFITTRTVTPVSE